MVKSHSNWNEDDVKIKKSRQFGFTNKTRPRTKDRPDYSKALTGTIIEVDRGRVRCLISASKSHTVVTAMKARELGKKSIVVGDLVSIVGNTTGEEGTLARVVSVHQRKNSLTRTTDDIANEERVIVANIDQMAIVISTTNPEPKTGFVDRALVVAYDQRISPLIIMTKQDLADGDEFLETYKDLEIPVYKIDKSSDLSKLKHVLANKITVLLGHSGVGKSTLVNNLMNSSAIENQTNLRSTGNVNAVTGRGRHTSSSAVALPLSLTFSGENFGWIIDTPGVRSFGVAHVEPSRVIAAFPEFSEPISLCPKNCSHDEKDCQLNSGQNFNDLNRARLNSLRRVLATGQVK
jgi:ribosome biogenesis GTPase